MLLCLAIRSFSLSSLPLSASLPLSLCVHVVVLGNCHTHSVILSGGYVRRGRVVACSLPLPLLTHTLYYSLSLSSLSLSSLPLSLGV
jgi:hypothetical protein